MMEFILGKYNYLVCILLMMIGFYAMIAKENLVKKVIGLNIFQTAIFLFYISVSYMEGATAPVVWQGQEGVLYGNPLPHVLILTAIVVGISMTALALGLIIKIYQEYGSIEENRILELNQLEEEQNLKRAGR
ncbi:MAG: cation:proton antiporter subunit C [Desulfotomaculum sp.]|nr:cation:proton antiporter subunit C [Desulfotomaculum sp.]